MGKLEKSLEAFAASLKKKSSNLSTLISDAEAMKNGIKTDQPHGRQTVEPMTRLRKSKSEAEKANKSPDMQFLRDTIHDILGV